MRSTSFRRGVYRPEHEKLDVYQRALAAAERAERIARALPATRADLADQMRRSSASVVLNIAEGANEFSAAEKARFYRFARRSAGETLAAVDLARTVAMTAIPADEARGELLAVMESLDKLVFALHRRR